MSDLQLDLGYKPPEKQTLLLIDGDHALYANLRGYVSDMFDIKHALSAKDGIGQAIHDQPKYIVTVIKLPDMEGIQLVRELRATKETSAIPVLLVATERDNQALLDLFRSEANVMRCLLTPFSKDDIRKILK